MRTVVVTDYPAEKLPEELRRGLDPVQPVKVIVVSEEPSAEAVEQPSLTSLAGKAQGLFRSPEEVDRYLSELRDEWP